MLRKICCLLLITSSCGVHAHADSLGFPAALQLAEQQSPDIAAQLAVVDALRASSVSAGRLPNPRLVLGLSNVPVSGVNQWQLGSEPMTMRQVGVTQAFPNGATRAAQIDVANAATVVADAELRVRRLNVRRDTALAWLDTYYLQKRLTLLDELEQENLLFADSMQARLAGGAGMAADVVAPQQEAADLADRRDLLNAELAKSRAGLRRWVGAMADASLGDDAPTLAIDINQLTAHVDEQTSLQVYAPMLQQAQAEAREAQAAKRPDWEVELSYGRRGAIYGDMVSAQVSIGLPLFQRTRIDSTISAKHAEVTRITAQRDATLRELTEGLSVQVADYLAVTRQTERMRNIRLPLAQKKIELQLASYQANQQTLAALLDARRELINERFNLVELQARQAALAATLYFTYGEGAP